MDNQESKTVAILNMGCKVNQYEAQGMSELFEKAGYRIVDFQERADVYLINTCTVTQIAARKSRQMIHRAKKLNPHALIIAAGCYVDRDDSLIQEGIIDIAIPNRHKGDVLTYIESFYRQEAVQISEDAAQPLWITSNEGKTRAFLKVQDGCRQFCTYCIIPYVRGPLTSRPIEECVREAAGLAKRGYPEIVLTGIHLSSYGTETGQDLADLIIAIAAIPQIKRILLGSLEPRMISLEFLQKVQMTDKLCPHFHLSLQSGCDSTLRSMNRRYSTQEYRQAVQLLRAAYPDVAITTDLIVGFPGESEEEHAASVAFAEEIQFAEAHVFRYSKMEGTAAARRTDQIDGAVKKQRSEDMLRVTAKSSRAFMERMQGKTLSILLEEKDPATECWTGYSPNYMKVAVEGLEGQWQGKEIPVLISGYVNMRSANHDAAGIDTILKGVPQNE